MKIRFLALPMVLCAANCAAQSGNLSDWPRLLDSKDSKAAKTLCTAFADSKDLAQQVEAQKCLANVALSGNDVILLEGDDAGGGSIRQGYKPEAIDEALVHLNLGLKLAPQDLSIHQGRLHVLEISGRYEEMVKALDESSSTYKGKEAPDAWLAYASELNDLRQYETALAFMKVLDKHYPNNSDIIGNVGAFLMMLKKDTEAIPYLQKSVDLAPNDAVNAWNLGRAYDYTNQIALADKWYKKGLSLPSDPDQPRDSGCLYAQFVEKKLHDKERACALEKKDCSTEEQTACASAPKPSKTGK